jgi:hypothetical protein
MINWKRCGRKMTTVWDMAPCNLVEVYRRFRDAYCLHQYDHHHVEVSVATFNALYRHLPGGTEENYRDLSVYLYPSQELNTKWVCYHSTATSSKTVSFGDMLVV